MKIIAHRTDNTAYEKRVNSCVKFAERDGIDFYYTEGEDGAGAKSEKQVEVMI